MVAKKKVSGEQVSGLRKNFAAETLTPDT